MLRPTVSWNKAPICCLRPDFYYCQTVAVLLMSGSLSDERTGLSFTIVAGPRHCSHSRVRVPWDSLPYFTVSDSRLLLSSHPTTRRAVVEVFDPASTRDDTSSPAPFFYNHFAFLFYASHQDHKSDSVPEDSHSSGPDIKACCQCVHFAS
jgi:hypothetical protein